MTIPIVYASTIALMWLVGIDFNVITLTAIILALGLLLDDTVVVMENIERHYRELGKDIHTAVFEGTTTYTPVVQSPLLHLRFSDKIFKKIKIRGHKSLIYGIIKDIKSGD